MSYYAVAKGRSVGIFSTWNECQEQVKGVKGSVYKKFASRKEAEDFIAEKTGKAFPLPSQKVADKQEETRTGDSKMGNQIRTGVSKSGPLIQLGRSVPKRSRMVLDVCNELCEARRELSLLRTRIPLNPDTESSFATVEQRIEKAIKFLNDKDEEANSLVDGITDEFGPPKAKSWRQDKFLTEGTKKQTTLNSDGFYVDADGFVHVYTDGACSDNGKGLLSKAGIGVWWAPQHRLNLAEPVSGSKATNNAAEIQAAIRAIEVAKENSIQKLWIQTDSMFLINCITKWIDGWKRNGWMTSSSKPVINKDDLVKLDNLLNSDRSFTVRWGYVAGHKGIEGNEGADELARAGAVMFNRKRKLVDG